MKQLTTTAVRGPIKPTETHVVIQIRIFQSCLFIFDIAVSDCDPVIATMENIIMLMVKKKVRQHSLHMSSKLVGPYIGNQQPTLISEGMSCFSALHVEFLKIPFI